MHAKTAFGLAAALAANIGGGIVLASEHLPGDAAAGARLAGSWCVECHEVDPQSRGPGVFGAPAFQDIADDPAVTELSLRVFLQTPHADMPNEQLTPAQTDDVISHILKMRVPR